MRGSLSRVMLLAAAGMVMTAAANAASLDIQGFVRFEPAIKINDEENPHNQYGNVQNGVVKVRNSNSLDGAALLGGGCIDGGASASTGAPCPAIGFRSIGGNTDADNEVNWFAGRAEIDFTVNVSEQVTLFTKLRVIGAPDVHDEFGNQDYFGADLFSGDRGTLLEVNGDNFMADLPAMYVDYNNGPLWLRAGNQTIAWGEAYFFRVLDVPNGLDLRRHATLDFAAEEFSDKRVASPAIRSSYRVTDTIEAEAFVQMFSPTVLTNENTTYNFVASQFILREEEFNDDRWSANFGGRLQGQFGDLGLQAIAVSRKNPDGVVRWTLSGDTADGALALTTFDADPQGIYSASEFFHGGAFVRLDASAVGANAINFSPTAQFFAFGAPDGAPGGRGAAGALPDDLNVIFGGPIGGPASGINCGGTGVGILDGACTPTAAIPDAGAGAFGPNPGPGAGIADVFEAFVGAAGTPGNLFDDKQLFDLFFQRAGNLRGTITREYDRETVLGGGINYLVHSSNEYLDQLVLRAEGTITPNKAFTNNLSPVYLEEDEFIGALVAEKYHRFSQAFPATYFVAQYMYRSDSDIFGRHLSGMGGTEFMLPTGEDNAQYISFAFQQPFPSLVWRADLAVLYDVQGGALIQPAVRWKPNDQYTLEGFVNILETNGGNDDFAQTVDWADEIGLRLGFQF